MFTIVLKEFFGLLVTVVIGFCQTMEKTEMILLAIIIIFIFFQTNDIAIVLNVVWEFGWVSKWVCGHDEMNAKTENTFNDPFCVRALIF